VTNDSNTRSPAGPGAPVPPPLPQRPDAPRVVKPPPLPQKSSRGPAAGWAERRAAPRYEVATEVSFESETNFYVGFTADISAGGLFVVSWSAQPIGARVSLTFTLPDTAREVKVEGVVRWVREHNARDPDLWPGMGIQFEGLEPGIRQEIERFLARREPLFYE
jgi:uncharacterized protein (TIGR02266 family)